jgi:hypothetical protein
MRLLWKIANVFSADILERLDKAAFDNKADYEAIKRKAESYYRNFKNCR